MAIPNLIDDVRTAAAKYPEAWRHAHTGNAHTEDFNRLLARDVRLKHGTRWGMNGKRGNPDDLSDDILAYSGEGTAIDVRTGGPMEIIDIIAGAGGPNPQPAWIVGPGGPGDKGTFVGDFTVPNVGAPTQTCRLGCSLFWGMTGVRHHPDKLRANLLWIRDTLGADYVRIFAVLGGDLHGGVDPWIHAGSWRHWSDWQSLIAHLTDLCFDIYGLQVQWTLFGSRGQTPALADCERVIDDFVSATITRASKIALVEVANEYTVNGFASSDLRHLARRLRSAGLPASIPLSLSSPTAVHACQDTATIHAEVRRLYDGLSEGNAITPHWCRSDHVAPDLGPSAPRLRYANEPRGPGASAGGDVDDPAVLAGDYRAAIAAGYAGYVYHPLGGIWGGMCHPNFPRENRWPEVFSSPNANATAAQLTAIRQGGSVPPIAPSPSPSLPAYDEGWLLDVVRPAVLERYALAQHPLDDRYPVWMLRTLYDHTAGLTKDAALAKHLADLEDALGL